MAKSGEPLTRQRVLEAALHLIDQEGLEGFSAAFLKGDNKRGDADGAVFLAVVPRSTVSPDG
jgi:hypothetical protein